MPDRRDAEDDRPPPGSRASPTDRPDGFGPRARGRSPPREAGRPGVRKMACAMRGVVRLWRPKRLADPRSQTVSADIVSIFGQLSRRLSLPHPLVPAGLRLHTPQARSARHWSRNLTRIRKLKVKSLKSKTR